MCCSTPYGFEWYAAFDGNAQSGTVIFLRGVANAGNNTPYAASEVSVAGSGLPSLSDAAVAVLYSPALKTKFGSTWYNSNSANTYYLNAPCQPYNAVSWNFNSAWAGTNTQYSCHSGRLW